MKLHAKSGYALAFILALSACGGNPARYVVDPPAPVKPVAVKLKTVELREVQLPAYGSESAIMAQQADGALRALRGAEWADGSVEAVTAELARALDLRSTASVAAEPWPLSAPAQAQLSVRFERIIAQSDGRFALSGQFALASADGQIREFIERFDVKTALTDQSPTAITTAYGQALVQLSDQIIKRLAR